MSSTLQTNECKWQLVVPDHPAVEEWVNRFTSEKHQSFQVQLDRAQQYVQPAQEIFLEKGLPGELVFVALVESGFMPKARSHASAVGMWQFIASTGKRFGLEQNEWLDERCHPFKAARAAADYLSFLYDRFGSWPLALAGYNAGENAVQAALNETGSKTFWELRDNGVLPAETREYVPKVLAAVKISRNPALYGFQFFPEHYAPRHETVSVPGGMKLEWLCKEAGISETALLAYNPELSKVCTPPGCTSYELSVPLGKRQMVLAALAEGPPKEEPSRPAAVSRRQNPVGTRVLVKPGDTLTSLAKKYGCPVTALAEMNGLGPRQPLKAGGSIRVPVGDGLKVASSPGGKDNSQGAAKSSGGKKGEKAVEKTAQPSRYQVQKGDSLKTVAARFKIPVERLCSINGLDKTQKLTPGKVLNVCSGNQFAACSIKRKKN
ncbi:MAG: transglycosylase SLT domain-containing protein [Deltaproteobacteria bacterium]|nr:transglycosylase SLT domain-containing protein [Deltaproteobacteria bacterium]